MQRRATTGYGHVREAYLSTSTDWPEGTWGILVPLATASWARRDAAGRQVGRPFGRPSFPTRRDRERWTQIGRPPRRSCTRPPYRRRRSPGTLNDQAISTGSCSALPKAPSPSRPIREAAGDSGDRPMRVPFTQKATGSVRTRPKVAARAALARRWRWCPALLHGELRPRPDYGVSYKTRTAGGASGLDPRTRQCPGADHAVRSGELRAAGSRGQRMVRPTRERP